MPANTNIIPVKPIYTGNNVTSLGEMAVGEKISGAFIDFGNYTTVANTQALHTSVTANLNSYIANTNPRLTNVLSSISGTNTAIRSLVDTKMSVANTQALFNSINANNETVNTKMSVANTQLLVNSRLGKSATVTLTGDITASASAFSANAVSISTTLADSGVAAGTYGNSSVIPVISVDSKGRITTSTTTSVAGVTSVSYYGANATLRVATADGTNHDATISTNDKMTVANAQVLHTSITANLNSYIANTNPRITNLLSSVSGTNTAIRSLVSTESGRVDLVNTNLTGTNTAIRTLVSDRMQVANVHTLFTNETANTDSKLNSYVANTNPRITNILSSVASTNTALRTYTDDSIAALANSAPVTLNTLNELAAALGDDANFATTLTTNLGQKLGSAASVTLNGDVAGTANFSANAVTITTTVADDSHNHIIGNVDGLQTALDAKATWSGLTATNTAIRSLISSNDTDITNLQTEDGDLWSGLTATNTAIRTLVSDRMQVANVTSRFVTSDASIADKMSVANTQALFASVSANNSTINTKMSVANTQALHTSVTANLNSYIANTNPRLTAIQSDIDSNEVMERAALANTNVYISNTLAKAQTLANARLGKTATVTLTGDITASASAFSANAVSVATTLSNSGVSAGTYGNSSAIGVVTIDAKGRVTGATTADVAGVTSVNYYGANATLRIATADGTNFDTGISTNDKMTVANTQALHTSVTANLNSYIANTNPRITNILSSVSSTNTALRTYTDDSIAALANSAPVTLNTLNELAAALGDDANFATTLTTNLGQKLGSSASVTLTGDVSGTANFSANAVTITATVADDSHNHIIGNVDGLQTELDTKSTWSGLTTTNTAIRSLVSDRMQVANTTLLVNDRMQVANVTSLLAGKIDKVGGIVINNRTVISSDGLLDTTQLGGGFSDSSLYIFPTGSLDGDDTYVGETRVRKDPFGVTTINIYDCMEPVGHYKATDLGSL